MRSKRFPLRLVFLVIGIVCYPTPGIAGTFQEQPITEGLHELTAYPLNGGGIRIGDLSFPFEGSQLRWLALDYGLTNDLQIGTALPANFLGTLNLLAKYRLLSLSSAMDFSIPLSITLTLGEVRELNFASGMIFSGRFDENFGYHGGLWFLISNAGGSGISTFYLMTDLLIHPDAKLIFELDLYPAATDSLLLSLGELQRFGPVNLRVVTTWILPSRTNVVEADIFFRF